MSTQDHAAILKAAITGVTKRPTLDHDEAQASEDAGSLPTEYAVIYLTRRFGDEPVRDGAREDRARRLQVRIVARSVEDARTLEDRVFGLFDLSTVNLGDTITHLAYETGGGNYEADDQGFYSDLISWTYSV